MDGLPVSPEGGASIGLVRSAGGWKVAYASSTLVGSEDLANTAELTGPEALAEALTDAGERVSLVELEGAGSVNGWRRIEIEGVEAHQLVRRVAFPTPQRGVRVAYETVYSDGVDTGYRHFVDAETGAILFREDIVESLADNPSWEVFPANPEVTRLNRFPYGYPSTDTREVWCWENAQGCDRVIANAASPLPWDVDPATLLSTNTTIGNNANSKELWFAPPPPALPGTLFRPTSATRDYRYPWTNAWFESGCDPAQLTGVGVTNDIAAADGESVRHAQPDARLGLQPRVYGGQRGTDSSRTSAGRARQRPRRRPFAGRSRRPRLARQRQHDHAARRDALDHQHVPLAAGRRRASTPRASTATTTWR